MNKVGYDYKEASDVIQKKACFFHAIIVTPDGTNASYATLYEGENTNAPKIATIRCTTDKSTIFVPPAPKYLGRGLYVEFETNLSNVSVWTESAEPKPKHEVV